MRAKALACMRDGRVVVTEARAEPYATRPRYVVAQVRSSRPERTQAYIVDLLDSTWSCTCAAGNRRAPCPHIAAVQLVTGHPSAAAKVAPGRAA